MKGCIPAILLGVLSCQSSDQWVIKKTVCVDCLHVHPACVYELLTDLADPQPISASVDVSGCMESNRHFGGKVTEALGVWKYTHPDLLGEGGFFSYSILGVTEDDVYVLHTTESGGGSGVFHTALFVLFTSQRYLTDKGVGDRLVMASIGEIPLGDRPAKAPRIDEGKLVYTVPGGEERRVEIPTP